MGVGDLEKGQDSSVHYERIFLPHLFKLSIIQSWMIKWGQVKVS